MGVQMLSYNAINFRKQESRKLEKHKLENRDAQSGTSSLIRLKETQSKMGPKLERIQAM